MLLLLLLLLFNPFTPPLDEPPPIKPKPDMAEALLVSVAVSGEGCFATGVLVPPMNPKPLLGVEAEVVAGAGVVCCATGAGLFFMDKPPNIPPPPPPPLPPMVPPLLRPAKSNPLLPPPRGALVVF